MVGLREEDPAWPRWSVPELRLFAAAAEGPSLPFARDRAPLLSCDSWPSLAFWSSIT